MKIEKTLIKIIKVILIIIALLIVFIAGIQVGIYETNKKLHNTIDTIMNTDLQGA